MFNTTDRTNKDKVREIAIANFDNREPAKRAVFLPAVEHLCCLGAKESGLISLDTHMIIIEKDINVLPLVQNKYQELVESNILSSNVAFFPKEVHEWNADDLNNIDFAFFDWYDQCNFDNIGFLRHCLSSSLSEEADVSFTFFLNNRNNKFTTKFNKFLNSDLGKEVREKVKETWFIPKEEMFLTLAALRIAFNYCDFYVPKDPQIYRDSGTSNILFVRLFDVIQKEESTFSEEVMDGFDKLLLECEDEKFNTWIKKNSGKKTKTDAREQRQLAQIDFDMNVLETQRKEILEHIIEEKNTEIETMLGVIDILQEEKTTESNKVNQETDEKLKSLNKKKQEIQAKLDALK